MVTAMNLLRYFASAFINFFGITQPSREEENRASLFIAFLFASMLAMLGVILFLLVHVFHS
jgi:flagellar biogenesis protein FliO